jgi:hypothetical protein
MEAPELITGHLGPRPDPEPQKFASHLDGCKELRGDQSGAGDVPEGLSTNSSGVICSRTSM